MKRILLAGLLGTIVMFLWTFVAHEVLPLGETGIREMPNEAPAMAAMQASMGKTAGLYFFPGMGAGPDATRAQKQEAMKTYEQKLTANPSGLLIYNPPGARLLSPMMFVTEFLAQFVEALLAAFLLSKTNLASFGARFGFVVLVGVVAAVSTNVSYWNWYGFPTNYTAAYMFVEVVKFACAGLVAAWLLKPTPASMAARA